MFLVEDSGLGFHVEAYKRGVFTHQKLNISGEQTFFNTIGKKRSSNRERSLALSIRLSCKLLRRLSGALSRSNTSLVIWKEMAGQFECERVLNRVHLRRI